MNVSFQPKIGDLYLENIFSLHSNMVTFQLWNHLFVLLCFIFLGWVSPCSSLNRPGWTQTHKTLPPSPGTHLCATTLGRNFPIFVSLVLNIFCSFSVIALEKERSWAKYLKTFSVQCLSTHGIGRHLPQYLLLTQTSALARFCFYISIL